MRWYLRSPLLTLDLGMKRVAREIGIAILEENMPRDICSVVKEA
jgi:hypothetical protein